MENEILYELQKALSICNSGRPGPVWIDIPLDVQSKIKNVYGKYGKICEEMHKKYSK